MKIIVYISSIPGWTFDDKCYLGGQKWLWPCPIGVMLHARLLHPCIIMYGILWVICSFKCLALALVFVYWPDNLTEWRLLSISSIPGWTFDDKCYLGGQKWHWTCPGGFLLQPRHLYTVYCGWCVPLKIHRYFPFLLIDLKISQNEDYCLSHRSAGWTFDDKCYLGGQKWLWPMYGILCVNGSFKCLAWALVFVN